MTPKIPDAETRQRLVDQLRESNRQLEAVTLALDEIIAQLEARYTRTTSQIPRN